MAFFVLIGVLRGFPAAAYRRTPRRKPLCGLDQNKNCSFLNRKPHYVYFKFMDEHFLVSFLVLRIDTFKEKCCSPDSKIKKKIVGDHESTK